VTKVRIDAFPAGISEVIRNHEIGVRVKANELPLSCSNLRCELLSSSFGRCLIPVGDEHSEDCLPFVVKIARTQRREVLQESTNKKRLLFRFDWTILLITSRSVQTGP